MYFSYFLTLYFNQFTLAREVKCKVGYPHDCESGHCTLLFSSLFFHFHFSIAKLMVSPPQQFFLRQHCCCITVVLSMNKSYTFGTMAQPIQFCRVWCYYLIFFILFITCLKFDSPFLAPFTAPSPSTCFFSQHFCLSFFTPSSSTLSLVYSVHSPYFSNSSSAFHLLLSSFHFDLL